MALEEATRVCLIKGMPHALIVLRDFFVAFD